MNAPSAKLQAAFDATPRERIPSDGHTTCLWHRQHEHYLKSVVPLLPRCPLCGGVGDHRQPAHALCHARQERGLPTPRLDSIRQCGCARCAKARGDR